MKTQQHHHDPVSNSMTDLMTSLAVIFILLMVAYLNKTVYEAKAAKQVITQLMTGTKTKRDGLKETLESLGIAAEVDPKDPLALVIHIGEDKLQFDHDRSELKQEGKQFLQGFIPKLARVLSTSQFNDDLQSVLIEGHTDSDGEDEHNLRLSQDRSYAVLLFALNDCHLTGDLRSRLLRLISASGRGESDLISNAAGEESKERSRRVAVKIRVKSIEQKRSPELERILGSRA